MKYISVIRFLCSFAGLSFLSSIVCFNSFYPSEARGQTSNRPLVQSTKLRASESTRPGHSRKLVQSTELRGGTERGNQNFTLQREKEELKARGVVLRFHSWPDMKQRKEVAGILKLQGLKRTRNIKDFKAQLFEWEEGGLKPSRQAEQACVQIRGLSYVRRCSPDHLLPVNASRTEQDKQSRTEAVE